MNTGEDIARSEEFVIAITMDQTIFSFETLITLCTVAMMTLHEEHLTNQLLLYIYKLPVLPFVHHSKIEQVKYIYGILFIIIWDLYRIYPFTCTVCCLFQIVCKRCVLLFGLWLLSKDDLLFLRVTFYITVRCRHHTVNFLQNPHNRHPVSCR